MDYALDEQSRIYLQDASDELFLGVVHLSENRVVLHRGYLETDVGPHRFKGHDELVRAGLAEAGRCLGFSVIIKSAAVTCFYRNSILNRPESAISGELTRYILGLLGVTDVETVRIYPKVRLP